MTECNTQNVLMFCLRVVRGAGAVKGPVVKLGGISVAVQSFKARMEELQALADCLPSSREARKRCELATTARCGRRL